MALDNNKTAIIRSHKESFAKNHNQRSNDFLESVLKNEPDWENGRDDGEVTKPKTIPGLLNDELERIVESIKNNTQLIY